MATALDRVINGLSKVKSIGESSQTLGERDKIIRLLKIDLTFLNNIPPCFDPNPKECIVASNLQFL